MDHTADENKSRNVCGHLTGIATNFEPDGYLTHIIKNNHNHIHQTYRLPTRKI